MYFWLGNFRQLYTKSIKQQRKRRASGNKTKLRQNENRRRNNMIKNEQISFEVTHTWDCFMTVIFICVSVKNISTEH